MRRVVTGEDEQGRSGVVHDGQPPQAVSLAVSEFVEQAIWQAELPALGTRAKNPTGEPYVVANLMIAIGR